MITKLPDLQAIRKLWEASFSKGDKRTLFNQEDEMIVIMPIHEALRVHRYFLSQGRWMVSVDFSTGTHEEVLDYIVRTVQTWYL